MTKAEQVIYELASLLAEEVVKNATPKLIAHLESERAERASSLLTIKEAAEALNVGTTTIRRLVNSGQLKRVAGMKEIRIKRGALNDIREVTHKEKK